MLLRSLFHSGILSLSRVTARLCVLAVTAACAVSAAPALKVTSAALPNGTVGTTYSQTLSASGGSGTYSWSVTNGSLPAGLSLSTGGAITGTPTAAGPANFTVQVKDGSQNTATKDLSIAVTAAPLHVATGSLPNGMAGAAYSETLGGTGGTGGYSWSLTTGSLPAGLSLSGGGTISGTPTAVGPSSFTVQVKDSAQNTATKALSISVAPAPLTITTTSLPNGTAGTGYSQTIAATGGTGGYVWSIASGSLPAGLNLSSALTRLAARHRLAGGSNIFGEGKGQLRDHGNSVIDHHGCSTTIKAGDDRRRCRTARPVRRIANPFRPAEAQAAMRGPSLPDRCPPA